MYPNSQIMIRIALHGLLNILSVINRIQGTLKIEQNSVTHLLEKFAVVFFSLRRAATPCFS